MTRIYLFSPIPYSFLHQRPQKLADQFVARGIPVTFIEPCGFTEYLQGKKNGLAGLIFSSIVFLALGAAALALPGLSGKVRRRGPAPGAPAGLRIVQMQMVYPSNRVDWPLLEKFNASVFRQALRFRVLRTVSEGEFAVALVENPFWGAVLREGDFDSVAYDCLDELTLFAGRASADRFAGYERRLLAMSGAVFVTAEALEERLHTLEGPAPGPVRVPNGVDVEWFEAHAADSPPELSGIRAPVAGYVGVLRSWFDYELLGGLARSMPDVVFAIVGPLDFEFRNAHLRSIPNLLWIGRRDYATMPGYIGRFDVCLIPFVEGKVSATTNPVKVFEYFALGKPVVATPMRELQPFAREGLLRLARGEREFADGIRAALAERDDTRAAGRRAVARAHSWRSLADGMLARMEGGNA